MDHSSSVKKATLTIFSMSFFMLFTILLVVVEPNTPVKIVLVLVFAFLGYGLECFFTIGSEKRKAPFRSTEFAVYSMLMPSLIYLVLGLANFRNLRSELMMTSLAAFITLLLRGFYDSFTGRNRLRDLAEKDKLEDDSDNNDKNDKGD